VSRNYFAALCDPSLQSGPDTALNWPPRCERLKSDFHGPFSPLKIVTLAKNLRNNAAANKKATTKNYDLERPILIIFGNVLATGILTSFHPTRGDFGISETR
jgi:hypothetical protein